MKDNMNYRMIKITAGMTGEFEIISTNAPDQLIEKQLKDNIKREENLKPIENPYGIIEKEGYTVNLIGCHSIDEEPTIDKEFDYYDY